MRNVAYDVARCPGYEFEDVIANELEPGAAFIEPLPGDTRQLGRRLKRWLRRRDLYSGPLGFGAPTKSLGQDLDLFFTAPAEPRDLLALDTVHDWRNRSRVAVCYLQELWISQFDRQLPTVLPILKQFDHVFVGLYHTAEALSKRLGQPVDYLPLGIDAELWNPYKGAPKPRVIDACAIGNMDPETHRRLWDWAERTGRYYSFTTTGSAILAVPHDQHRKNLAQTLQRSKFFFTYMGKRALTLQRGTQQEFGPRYYEGAGAGAIQIGDAVKSNPAYLELMNWDGAVIEAPYTDADMPALIEDLEKDAPWLDKLRRTNVAQCLTRHDHLNRWDMVLKAAGFEEMSSAAARRARLRAMADGLGDDLSAPVARTGRS